MKNLEIMELEVVDLENAIPYDSKAAIKIWDMAISEIKKAQSLGLDKDFELRNERILFYIQKRKQEAVILGKVPQDLELIKKTVYSRDSILKILNEKDE